MSTDNKSLKFIHLSSTTSAQHSDANVGAIIFEPKSGRIAVDGAKGLEYYGGGRVSDAKFENSILTISFNNGDKDIVLDFTDTASASGVDKILGKLRYDVNALADKVGDDSKGLVKKINDNTSNISANKGEIDANKAAIAAINHETTGILAQAKKYTDGKVGDIGTDVTVKKYVDAGDAKALADAKSYTDTAANALKGRVDTLETTVSGPATGLVKKVADLQALHANKTDGTGMMTVAEEAEAAAVAEVAKVVAGADEKYDTLKEIADWIANDTTGSVQMANDIKTLKNTVGKPAAGSDAATGLHKDIADNKAAIATNATAINALQALHDGSKKVAQEVADGIAGIAEASVTSDDGADVKVTVKTAAGSVSDVIVDASVLRNDLGVKTAAASADTAFGRIKALETTVSDPTTGLEKKVADNTTNIGANTAAIKVLQDAQSSGSLIWSSWAD